MTIFAQFFKRQNQKAAVAVFAAILRSRYWIKQGEGRWALGFSAMGFGVLSMSAAMLWLAFQPANDEMPWSGRAVLLGIFAFLSAAGLFASRIAWLIARDKAGTTPKKNEIESRISDLRHASRANREAQALRESLREGSGQIGGGKNSAPKRKAKRL